MEIDMNMDRLIWTATRTWRDRDMDIDKNTGRYNDMGMDRDAWPGH